MKRFPEDGGSPQLAEVEEALNDLSISGEKAGFGASISTLIAEGSEEQFVDTGDSVDQLLM
jgi:hypothetical protein